MIGETLLVGGAALSVWLSQKFVRDWWFSRQHYDLDNIALLDDFVMTPVDGTIVYVKEVKDGKVTTEKKGRVIAEDWVDGESGYLIGIYMCVYDRHFVVSPVSDFVRYRHVPTTANIPMMDLWEYINFYYVGRFVDWFEEKAFSYKLHNEKIIYEFDCGIKMMGIADKFVNKIEVPEKLKHHPLVMKGEKIGHIRRGSQVDVFIPEYLFAETHLNPGDRVEVGSVLCQIKTNN